nr:chymotrypsin-like protease CTRL-1 [Drosophila bipectinata]
MGSLSPRQSKYCLCRITDQPEKARLGNSGSVPGLMPEDHDVAHILQKRSYNNRTLSNDIALVKLTHPVQYKDHIKPICILLPPLEVEANEFIGTGWRVPQFQFSTHDLRPIFMQRVNSSVCTEKTGEALISSQFCAKNPNPVTMEGPAGGALYRKVVLNGVVRVIQLGIGSYNQHDFGDTRIFTDVLSFSPWIQKVVTSRDPKSQEYGY